MGSPSIPAQPPPPDYSTANKTAIETDISTLPLRNKINQAAQLGQKVEYDDPITGQKKTADFTGMGSGAAAQQAAQILSDQNAAQQRQQLQLRQELGVANAQQTAAEIRAADPTAATTRDTLTAQVQRGLNDTPAAIGPSSGVRGAASNLGDVASRAPGAGMGRLGSIYDEATRLPGTVSDSSTDTLNSGLQQAMDEYRLGTKLDPNSERSLMNEVRAGQVARGNYLGDAAAVAEASQMGAAGQAMKQQRLQNLLDIQNRAFGQNQSIRQEGTQNQLSRVGTLSGLANQIFGQQQGAYNTQLNAGNAALGAASTQAADERAARGETFGQNQQRLANASAMVLGQPITNQFGSLQGAQNGAVAFNPAGYQAPGQVNQNAGQQGAQFQQGNFGTLGNMWNTSANIASQGNPWMSLAGNALGAATAAMI